MAVNTETKPIVKKVMHQVIADDVAQRLEKYDPRASVASWRKITDGVNRRDSRRIKELRRKLVIGSGRLSSTSTEARATGKFNPITDEPDYLTRRVLGKLDATGSPVGNQFLSERTGNQIVRIPEVVGVVIFGNDKRSQHTSRRLGGKK